jgi:hypothetical protein
MAAIPFGVLATSGRCFRHSGSTQKHWMRIFRVKDEIERFFLHQLGQQIVANIIPMGPVRLSMMMSCIQGLDVVALIQPLEIAKHCAARDTVIPSGREIVRHKVHQWAEIQ